MNPDSGSFVKIHDFALNTKPEGVLMQADNGKIYGMTMGGGSSGAGSLYSLDTSTNIVSTIYNLQFGVSPRYPLGGLVQANNGLSVSYTHLTLPTSDLV